MKKLLIIAFLFALSANCVIGQAQDVVVRQAGDDGVNTYRIPALVYSKQGTLLAAWDNRYETSRDLQGHIDIGMRRSTDGGKTWLPMQVVLDMGTWGDLPEKFNGVSDAQLFVDQVTGRIWVAGLWMHGVLDDQGRFTKGLTVESKVWKHQWGGVGSQPGLTPYETSQFIMAYSDNDGKTWSKPVNITEATKPAAWWLYAPAPGNGITMRDGTLVMPTQGRDQTGRPFSNITYSKDRGETWTTTSPAKFGTSECAVVELADGSLMLNMRDNSNHRDKDSTNGRAIFTTKDFGRTWTEHSTSKSVLKEPVCMASLVRAGDLLLFSNPAVVDGRYNMTLKVSCDEGKTWNDGLLLDAGESFGYSSIAPIDSQTVGVLWEGSKAHMVFRAIKIKDLVAPASR